MCSLLCSTDVIAAVSIVKYSDKPKLYSIIFGEGVINDAVVIIIFNTIVVFSNPEQLATGPVWTSFLVLWDFCYLLIFSTLLGILIGILSALFLKHLRVISSNPIYEAGVLLCFGEMAYQTSEMVNLSGITTLLTTGIVMSHYSWPNLSE